MIYTKIILAALSFSSVTASLAHARRALAQQELEERQSTGTNNNQYWANDYAELNYTSASGGRFALNWANPPGGNFVVGKGYQPARDMLVNYTASLKPASGAWFYLALYGWTNNPLTEYYVIESMGYHNPSDNISATQHGCLTSDGGTYEIWSKQRINAPSILGSSSTFMQYWSIRTKTHAGGTINTGNHFRAWEAAGLDLGTQLFFDVVIEGQQGSGAANITVGVAPTTVVPETATLTRRTEKKAGTCPYTTTTPPRTTTTAKTSPRTTVTSPTSLTRVTTSPTSLTRQTATTLTSLTRETITQALTA